MNFLEGVERRRQQWGGQLLPEQQTALSQFFTPLSIARHMASLIEPARGSVSVLDAGAGVGILFAAVVERLCTAATRPERLHIRAIEVDPHLRPVLEETLAECIAFACDHGVACTGAVEIGDFLQIAAQAAAVDLLNPVSAIERDPLRPTVTILNPPYRKISSSSDERRYLRRLGIETTNLYTGFVSASLRLLTPGGQLVAITPRSFCNGRYFRPFREDLLQRAALTHLHLFETRRETFRDAAVLQETLIFRAVRNKPQPESIVVAHLGFPPQPMVGVATPIAQVLAADDPERYLHIPSASADATLPFRTSLATLGLEVSTGRVVDFRSAEFLQDQPGAGAVPLIYPTHCTRGTVCWPKRDSKKPNALWVAPETRGLLVPNGDYVLVKRFSAKEQARRIMASLYEGCHFPGADRDGVAFENHLNYFHEQGRGLDTTLARGVTAYLNAACVDRYFRRFSGHTQVNATDLRTLPYPTRIQLCVLGAHLQACPADRTRVDELVESLA